MSGSPSAPQRPLHDMGILVTGGGSGIGLAVSRRLLADGAAVTIAGRNAQRLRDARQILIDAGADPASIRAHAADMSREDAGRRAVEAASDLRGVLHAAVACAGEPRGQMAPVTQLDLDGWRRVFDNNVVATMLTLKYAAREMVRAGGGSFVAISSISSTMAARFFSMKGCRAVHISICVTPTTSRFTNSGRAMRRNSGSRHGASAARSSTIHSNAWSQRCIRITRLKNESSTHGGKRALIRTTP